MFNTLKNKLIINLINRTHLNADVYYAFIRKIPIAEIKNYIRLYEEGEK